MDKELKEINEQIKRKDMAIARCNDGYLQANLRSQIRDLQRQKKSLLARHHEEEDRG